MEDINKRQLTPQASIIWSGGMDSTACALEYLLNGYFIELITIELANVLDLEQEREAREKILNYFKEEFGNQIISHKISKIEICLPEKDYSPSFLDGGQAPIWASQAVLPVSSPKAIFGYIETDSMWHIKQEFVQLFDTTAKLFNKPIELIFPFEWFNKQKIFNRYYFERKNLFDILWVNCANGKHWKEESCDKAKEMQNLYRKYFNLEQDYSI